MKKMISIILMVIICASIAACKSTPNDTPSKSPSAQPSTPESTPETTPESTPETEEAAYEISYSNVKTYKNSIGTVYAQSIFEVTNTGTSPLYLSSGAYDLEDADGNLVKSSTMVSVYPDVISPGEKAYYYEEKTIDGLDDAIDLTILPRPDVKKAKVDCIRFSVSDFELSPGSYDRGVKMKGRVENTADETQNMIYIAAILFNDKDEPIGQIFTIVTEDLESGAKIGFEQGSLMLPDDVTLDSIARYEVFAYPMQMQF